MRKRLILVLLTVYILTNLYSCGKTKEPKPSPSPPAVPAPTEVTLTYPEQNMACTSGKVVTATTSSIIFTWNTSTNTTSYILVVKDLQLGTSSNYPTTKNTLEVTLLRDTPFSWYVISVSDKTSATAQSAVWKFYNSGVGVVSHPPFPADAISPAYGQAMVATNATINLAWKGTDTDGDIANYDIYLGKTSTPGLYKSNVTTQSLQGVTVDAGSYYWKIVTRDALGNTSDSGNIQFTVK